MSLVASYGPKRFVVSRKKIYTVSDASISSSIDFEEKENGKGVPIKRKKHDNGEEFTVNTQLLREYVNVMDEFYSWKNIKTKAKAYYFVLGNRKISRYKLLVTNVSLSNIQMVPGGQTVNSATLAITFQETGSKKKPLTSKKAKAQNKKLAAKATRNCKKKKKKKSKLKKG